MFVVEGNLNAPGRRYARPVVNGLQIVQRAPRLEWKGPSPAVVRTMDKQRNENREVHETGPPIDTCALEREVCPPGTDRDSVKNGKFSGRLGKGEGNADS